MVIVTDAVARLVACPLCKQWARHRSSRLAHSFLENNFPLPLIQEVTGERIGT